MNSNYAVVYDACVMYPAPLRSLLMYLALSDLYRAHWTDDIHEEWIRNLLINRPDLNRKQLEKVRSLMDSHVPGALVTGSEGLISTITLPDQDDRRLSKPDTLIYRYC